ncbi:Hint domain-containing protein [Sedimentitalea sp. JM2-8]|uniref:Hint domain-containing protein n=1 Tax=Sedimentitalea xiamensis TaxID=3050037 RepID=A0ABT7FDM1_9RHOB|nr:Hint domain-containing protein [Sedimentitalea xiamensis]MDK3073197.1 Hint domain-containing protein [Sedimentitalea xiamensis]
MTLPVPLNRDAHRVAPASSAAKVPQPKPQLRRYDVCRLSPDGTIAETRHVAPALPLFEDAFCAFSRGSLIETDAGLVAVEDLLPGDRIVTSDGKAEPLVWKGSTTLVPGRPGPQGRKLHLTRIMTDSFGIQRPISCLIAGPSARLLHTPGHLRSLAGGQQILSPVQACIDGMNVVETAPPTPVQLYHLCLATHAVIRVGGLDFETYHPGPNAGRMVSHAMRPVFLNLFPHVSQFCDFGALRHPRAGDGQIHAVVT